MNATESAYNPARIRTQLLQVAQIWLPQLPRLIQQASAKAPMSAQMAITAARPFLPKLEQLLLSTIETASDEKVIELARFVEGVALWLKEEPENPSS